MAAARITYSNPRLPNFLQLDAGSLLPTDADMLYALERQKSRILQRTERGVDYEERPFAPYSTKGPYYYYPNAHIGNLFRKSRSALTAHERGNVGSEIRQRGIRAAKRFQRSIHSGQVTPGGGLKFTSYAAFKASLGRTNVDLTGPRAPHMLQAIVTEAESGTKGSLGIYGEPGKRAAGHNEGARRLPQRQFFAVSTKDKDEIVKDLSVRIRARLKQEFGV